MAAPARLVILTLANTASLIAKKVLGGHFCQPVDGGLTFFDKRPLFGSSKTICRRSSLKLRSMTFEVLDRAQGFRARAERPEIVGQMAI